ncbi:MAG: ketopantoate reductase family protein [Thermoflexaceae bacterium]|nr:ketopantoate reductase family protein [Thermoflexaceae bacterium]
MKEIQSTAIVGMGALGILFGSFIQEKCGRDSVAFVVDEERKKRYSGSRFTCNGEEKQFKLVESSEAEPVDLLIVAVKYTGLKSAIEVMKNCVGEDTVIISVLNGINSEEILGEAFGMDKIIYTVAQGMDAMKFGCDLKYTQMGELHVGLTKSCDNKRYERLLRFFDRTGMPYVAEDDILYRMWGKFMLNVGLNQTCMVYGVNYRTVLSKGEPNRTMISAMREVIVLAQDEGVNLSEKDLNFYVDVIKTLNPEGTPSMGQDRINKKASEVDMFAGIVKELAAKHGRYVPVNDFLYERAKEIEKEYIK